MKERIEKKLGCTIEEYYDRMYRQNTECINGGTDGEIPSISSVLNYDEMDFAIEYMMNR